MIRVACVAVLLALAAQTTTVHFNYHGDWSGLFCVGDRAKIPAELPRPFVFADSWGYDGQAYRIIAHDPLFRRDFAKYIDAPRMRYNRILVPGLAALLSLGSDKVVEPMYVAVMLAFTGLGAYCLALFSVRLGRSDWFGLLFLLVPATLVGLDRMTVDLALAALCVAYLVARPGSAGWLAVLIGAALCRETGFLLIGAAALVRPYRWSALFCALPALIWQAFTAAHTAPIPGGMFGPIPLYGLTYRILHPMGYPLEGLRMAVVQTFDYVALLGAAMALPALWALRKRLRDSPELLSFALPFLFVSYADVWSGPYAFGRTMTPLWLFLACRGAQQQSWICLAPVALIDSRIGLQLAAQVVQTVRTIFTGS